MKKDILAPANLSATASIFETKPHKQFRLSGDLAYQKKYTKWRNNRMENYKKSVRVAYCHECAICRHSNDLELHHIVAVKDGGEEKFTNYILLCHDCHKQAHEGEILVGDLLKHRVDISAYNLPTLIEQVSHDLEEREKRLQSYLSGEYIAKHPNRNEDEISSTAKRCQNIIDASRRKLKMYKTCLEEVNNELTS
ncbi:MAG: HNH endonuclease [Planctomycetota bacterium]|jgi:hypothetical protein|nr:HNH endonuclease [Planctomycetota bacterium]